jgi:hypothetical protein
MGVRCTFAMENKEAPLNKCGIEERAKMNIKESITEIKCHWYRNFQWTTYIYKDICLSSVNQFQYQTSAI